MTTWSAFDKALAVMEGAQSRRRRTDDFLEAPGV